ncbi:hypothetical protein GOV07_04740 [Candidatus Woesearchaeota archaeon]|nr:hypothetical protein [Candidatus Woesearchaeota archaeon]
MMQSLHSAVEELKRVDHQIYVSLKYTRTVDVIQNILNRMVDGYSYLIDALLKHAAKEKKVPDEIPGSAIEKADLLKETYPDDTVIQDNIELYLLLRKLLRAKNVEREQEYRRHVTMKTIIEGREEIVNIDIITNYYLFQRDFLSYIQTLLGVKNESMIRDDDTPYF